MEKKNRKILILGNSHLVVFGFRGELIEKLISEGYDVTVAFPNGPFGEGEKTSKEYGCKFVEMPMNRRGKNPIEEIRLLNRYIKLIKSINPAIVLAYTVKCDIYGGIACRLLNIPFVPNITGLGKGLSEGGVTKKITIQLYRTALKKAECVFFQNTNDEHFFEKNNIKYKLGILLPGSGVNLKKYVPLPYPNRDKIVFTYIARVMKAKGIEQFLEAASYLKKKYPETEFHICGYCEENYKEKIIREQMENNIVYHGLVNNIVDYERISSCIVLPSFHPEGISNVLLEAAACARPIITTDRVGCRETVEDGVTGLLVKERDSQDLIEKMELFIKKDNSVREKMGIMGRKRIEKEFDRQIVVNEYIKIIEKTVGVV